MHFIHESHNHNTAVGLHVRQVDNKEDSNHESSYTDLSKPNCNSKHCFYWHICLSNMRIHNEQLLHWCWWNNLRWPIRPSISSSCENESFLRKRNDDVDFCRVFMRVIYARNNLYTSLFFSFRTCDIYP